MFNLIPTNQFKKDMKTLIKRSSKNESLVSNFLIKLAEKGVAGIEKKYYPHKLAGEFKDNWEAHIRPDLLIIWFELTENNEIILVRIGSHADLF